MLKKTADEIQTISNSKNLERFGLTLDDYVLRANLFQYFEKGLQNQVPLLTGWVTGDGALFGNSNTTLTQYQKEAQTKYGDKAAEFLNVFPAKTDDEVKAAQTK